MLTYKILLQIKILKIYKDNCFPFKKHKKKNYKTYKIINIPIKFKIIKYMKTIYIIIHKKTTVNFLIKIDNHYKIILNSIKMLFII